MNDDDLAALKKEAKSDQVNTILGTLVIFAVIALCAWWSYQSIWWNQ